MSLALSLGRRGLGRVWPNPAVGCILVKDGQIVGRGWTQDGGRPHAEVVALAQAGTAARGTTAYVTLEPCSHHGKTPPCSQALIDAGIAQVVCAIQDSDPRVSGRGFGMLRGAGISVDVGVLADQAAYDLAGFFLKTEHNRPLVTLKLATSFDGRIATENGDSQWITGPIARRAVHMHRARHDAVLVGAGTVRQDDPSLTVRNLGVDHQPIRVIASRLLDVPLTGKLAATARKTPVWLCHDPAADPMLIEAWTGLGATLLPVPSKAGRLDMAALMNALADQGLTRVYCEGGGTLAASLLRANLVDRLIHFTAGAAIGAEGLPSLGPLGLLTLSKGTRFSLKHQRNIDGDVLSEWTRI